MDAVALPPSNDSHADLDKNEDSQFVVGRLSNAVLDIIQEGLDHIMTYLMDLAVRSGQPPQQLIDRFIKQYAHLNSANDWNKYSKYFALNTQVELDCFRKTGPQVGTIDTKCKDTVASDTSLYTNHIPVVTVHKQCYKLFKQEYPETWQNTLTKFKESTHYTEAGKMVGQRQQMFHKSAKRFTQLASLDPTVLRAHLTLLQFSALSKAHGIEAAFVMAGSIVNQDALLGYSYTTPGVTHQTGLVQ